MTPAPPPTSREPGVWVKRVGFALLALLVGLSVPVWTYMGVDGEAQKIEDWDWEPQYAYGYLGP